jgi:hypothetical protein
MSTKDKNPLVDPTLLIPDHVRDNYVEKARIDAVQLGESLSERWGKQIAEFRAQHEGDGLAGWDHLANWAETVNPEQYAGTLNPDPYAVARMKALESEKREPTDVGALFTPQEQERVAEEVRHARRTSARSPLAADPALADEDEDTLAKRKAQAGQRTTAESAPKREG